MLPLQRISYLIVFDCAANWRTIGIRFASTTEICERMNLIIRSLEVALPFYCMHRIVTSGNPHTCTQPKYTFVEYEFQPWVRKPLYNMTIWLKLILWLILVNKVIIWEYCMRVNLKANSKRVWISDYHSSYTYTANVASKLTEKPANIHGFGTGVVLLSTWWPCSNLDSVLCSCFLQFSKQSKTWAINLSKKYEVISGQIYPLMLNNNFVQYALAWLSKSLTQFWTSMFLPAQAIYSKRH